MGFFLSLIKRQKFRTVIIRSQKYTNLLTRRLNLFLWHNYTWVVFDAYQITEFIFLRINRRKIFYYLTKSLHQALTKFLNACAGIP